jgi:DNA-binding response OmpR family regulator
VTPPENKSKQFRVLVVEDEESLGRLYVEEFAEEGYSTEVANTVDDAVGRIRDGSFDVVILDLKLGVEDGADILRHIMEHHRDLPVIVNTGCGELKSDFRLWGADSFMVKSSDMGDLKRRLAEIAKRKNKSLGSSL